jgi:DNA invertase Pin-like site-specific DNA recombinase
VTVPAGSPSTIGAVPVDPAAAKRLTTAATKAREWTEERNRLIREAHAAGGGVREIARLVGLTHPTVLNILKPRAR